MRLDPIQSTKTEYKWIVEVEHIILPNQIMREGPKEFKSKVEAMSYISGLHALYKKDPSKKIGSATNIYITRIVKTTDVFIALEGE